MAHCRMISRVEFDKILTISPGVKNLQPRRIFIGQPADFPRRRTSGENPEFTQFFAGVGVGKLLETGLQDDIS